MLKSIGLFRKDSQGNKELSDAVKKIGNAKCYERLVGAIVESFMEFTKTKKASLMVPDEDGLLSVRAASGLSPAAWKTVRLSPSQGVVGEALKVNDIVFIHEVSSDSRYKRFFQEQTKPLKGGSLLVIPLTHRQEHLGVLSLHDVANFEKETLRIMAALASKSLKNAVLEKVTVSEPMTGLYNQNYFKKRLADELNLSQKYGLDLSLMIFDIDFFKRFNDSYGHLAGDFVIKEIARLLKDAFRFSDVKSRYGGEEFAVIMPQTHISDAHQGAERLRESIAETMFNHEGRVLKVTISAGVAGSSIKMDALKLIKNADEALYKSKQLGRNRTTVSDV